MAFGLRSEKVLGELSVQLVSKISDLCGPDPPTSRTDRQTDRQTDAMRSQIRNTALCTIVHRVVKNSYREYTVTLTIMIYRTSYAVRSAFIATATLLGHFGSAWVLELSSSSYLLKNMIRS